MLLTFITRITFCEDVRFRFWTLFDTQLIHFVPKYFLLFIIDFQYKNFKSLLHYKFTVQRVNEASLFEVTELHEVARTSKGFIMLPLTRVVRQYPAQCFGKIPGFNLSKLSRLSGVFPPFVGHFFKRARQPEVKPRHVVYEV